MPSLFFHHQALILSQSTKTSSISETHIDLRGPRAKQRDTFCFHTPYYEDCWSNKINGRKQGEDLTYPMVNSGEESRAKICWDTHQPLISVESCSQLMVNNKPLFLSANNERIYKLVSSSADIPFHLPHVLFNVAWFSTRPCEISLSSLQVVAQVDGSHRSTYDLTHHTCSCPFAVQTAPNSALVLTTDFRLQIRPLMSCSTKFVTSPSFSFLR